MLKLHDEELKRLGHHISEVYREALEDHSARMHRWAEYYAKWRTLLKRQRKTDEGRPNYRVPLVQWNTLAKQAQIAQGLFGDDAEITAAAVGPSDFRTVHKVARYVHWLFFQGMRSKKPLLTFLMRLILFGRAIAYRPYVVETRRAPGGKREKIYEGPAWIPMAPDDIVVPAEKVDSIQKFSWVVRRVWLTPQQLLDGEREKRYFGIKKNFRRIHELANMEGSRDPQHEADQVKQREDEAEGVLYDGGQTAKGKLLLIEWYGTWRLPRDRAADTQLDDWRKRDMDESELVVRYLPELELVCGVDDLVELYPRVTNRRPFSEANLVEDGSYWSAGAGELLEEAEEEVSQTHNLATEAFEFAIGPTGLYQPGAGFDPNRFEYAPFKMNPCQNPESVKFIQGRADLAGAAAISQALQAFVEKVWGVNDQSLGRAIDRPNAPRSAAGQIALIEQGNIRLSLDLTIIRECLSVILRDLWELDSSMSPEKVFFRVTEEEAKGLFDVKRGGSYMTAGERGGRYDFDLKFATSVWSREAQKQHDLEAYQLALGNPLIVQNPRALWLVTSKAFAALGWPNFGDLVPEPPDPGLPKSQREEWTLMLQGEEVDVNPADNDDLHILELGRFIEQELMRGEPDEQAINLAAEHKLKHEQQKRQKLLMQALTERLVQGMAATMRNPSLGGIDMGQPMAMAPADMMATLGALSTAGGQQPGAPGAGGPPQTGGAGAGA